MDERAADRHEAPPASVSHELPEQPSAVFLGGEWRPAPDSYEQRNPARPREAGRLVGAADLDQLEQALAAASAAAVAWGEAPADERVSCLRRFADLIDGARERLASAIVEDVGKTVRDARAEVGRAVDMVRYLANEPLRASGSVYAPPPGTALLHTVREPLGVVAVVTPWNFPVMIPAWKIASALAWGNAVVWKPAELAARSALELTRLGVAAGVPDGVLSMLSGWGTTLGPPLVSSTRVAAVSFTGSTAVGRTIAGQAAPLGKKLQLELGGKNPAIVLADADLERAAACIVRAAMLSTGQRCTATSRAIVVEPVFDELVSKLVDGSSALVVGDPSDEATDLGPVASERQHETVRGYLALARSESVEVACGGTASDPAEGFYVDPTVLVDVAPGSRLAREEIFGPVLSVIRAADADAAFRLANDSAYGLSGSLFTRDVRAALEGARRLQAGVVHVNEESTGVVAHVPFGGLKASSSHSRELGDAARDFFTDLKTIYVS